METLYLELTTIHGISNVVVEQIPFCKCVKLSSNDLFNEFRLCFVYDCENDKASTDVYDNQTGTWLFEFNEIDFDEIEDGNLYYVAKLEELMDILLTEYN